MSAPHYFLPSVFRGQLIAGGKLSAALLESRGLVPIFGDVERLDAQVSLMEIPACGPGGASGTMLVPLVPGAEPPVRLGYQPNFQEWTEHDGYWLGIDREAPPTPANLARTKQIGGYKMTMGDGHEWLVPILRRPDDSTELPSAFSFGADGRLIQSVRQQHRALWEDTAEVCQWFVEGTLFEVAKEHLPRIIDRCVRILGVNYRFDRVLQNVLGPIGQEEWAAILCYAIDWPTAQALDQKKRAGPSASTTNGAPPAEPGNISPGSAEAAVTAIDPVAESA